MRLRSWSKHIPNALTILRMILVVVFAVLSTSKDYIVSLCVLAVAFITDIFDGYLARKFNWVSNLGKLLDPIADKFLTVTALFCIWYAKQKTIYLILFAAILMKELCLIIGAVVKLKNKIVVHSDIYGKVATGFMFAGMIFSLLSLIFPVLDVPGMILLIIGTAVEFVALVHYGFVYLWGTEKKAT